MSRPECGAPRGFQRYCWSCKAELPEITIEDLLRFDIRRTAKLRKYGRIETVNGRLHQEKLDGGK